MPIRRQARRNTDPSKSLVLHLRAFLFFGEHFFRGVNDGPRHFFAKIRRHMIDRRQVPHALDLALNFFRRGWYRQHFRELQPLAKQVHQFIVERVDEFSGARQVRPLIQWQGLLQQ